MGLLLLAALASPAAVHGRVGYSLRGIGVQYGHLFPVAGGAQRTQWELSYERMYKSCTKRRPYWALAIGTEGHVQDHPLIFVRAALAPYDRMITRRMRVLGTAGLRAGETNNSMDAITMLRPEAGINFLSCHGMFRPRVSVLYGWEFNMGRSSVSEGERAGGGMLSVHVGMVFDLDVLRYRRYMRNRSFAE